MKAIPIYARYLRPQPPPQPCLDALAHADHAQHQPSPPRVVPHPREDGPPPPPEGVHHTIRGILVDSNEILISPLTVVFAIREDQLETGCTPNGHQALGGQTRRKGEPTERNRPKLLFAELAKNV